MCVYFTIRFCSLPAVDSEKHTNKHYVEHDYVLCPNVKTVQVGDLNFPAILIFKIVACHQHQGKLSDSVTKSAFQTFSLIRERIEYTKYDTALVWVLLFAILGSVLEFC